MITTPGNHITALDAATGETLWHYEHVLRVEKTRAGNTNRGPAIGHGKVFQATNDGRMIALDRQTGVTRSLFNPVGYLTGAASGDPARIADDFADEPMYEGVRQEKLDQWEALLHAAYRGEADGPVFVALGETVRALDIPKELLLDLLSAFRQDTEKNRYEGWDELLDYCRRSANPVGRLVLLVFDQEDPDLLPLSDAICTGLQLANHWQDAAVDYCRVDTCARHLVDLQ